MSLGIAENLRKIEQNIRDVCIECGRDPQSVRLIVVSKTFGGDKIKEAVQAGVFDVGENYVQELTEKRSALADDRIRWHFIGHLQSNKVKRIVEWIYLIHSVDNEGVAMEIQKRALRLNRTVDILVEINTSDEFSKFGVKPGQTSDLLKRISRFSNVRLRGLMTIGPFLPAAEQSRQAFRLLRNIFDEANAGGYLREPMRELSMGMTHDYAVAIQEGATMVRIGTAIFGAREKATT
ncbi:MAG: YggS family pyridoxal phosphate-dependent enzyme [Bacteroidota bacterium]|nr:YggS family pyridoxal phosphate-dependent enzyme [Bacteroidota bacterium]